MKKIISLILALMLVLCMGVAAFAEDTTTPTDPKKYDDMSTVTLTKEYKLTNPGTTSPAETFTFSELKFTGVADAGVDVDTANIPVPTIGSVTYDKGEAGSDNAKKNITINLPEYTAVGVYTYTFTETAGTTAGVTYRSDAIKLVVTVIEQNGKVRVAAVHTEKDGTKSGSFDNTYSAGSLAVKKTVTGLLGDKDKEFTVKVTFNAPTGKTVKSDITYVEDGVTKTISAGDNGWTGTQTVTIALKDSETITFTNIPYEVTYTVAEDDYTSEANGGYEAASYDDKKEGKITTDSVETNITNKKDGTIDMGISTDSLPYVVLLGVVAVIGAAMLIKRRATND